MDNYGLFIAWQGLRVEICDMRHKMKKNHDLNTSLCPLFTK